LFSFELIFLECISFVGFVNLGLLLSSLDVSLLLSLDSSCFGLSSLFGEECPSSLKPLLPCSFSSQSSSSLDSKCSESLLFSSEAFNRNRERIRREKKRLRALAIQRRRRLRAEAARKKRLERRRALLAK
jgi:hypothetical protein